jgi:hypothetical protein
MNTRARLHGKLSADALAELNRLLVLRESGDRSLTDTVIARRLAVSPTAVRKRRLEREKEQHHG